MARERRANGSLQHACVLTVQVTNEVLAKALANGGTLAVATIPSDAVIIDTMYSIDEASDATGTGTVDLGDGSTADRFFADLDITAAPEAGAGAITRAGTQAGAMARYATSNEVVLTANVDTAGTVGKCTLFLEYLRPDRAEGVS